MTLTELESKHPHALLWRYAEQDDTRFVLTCYKEAELHAHFPRIEDHPPVEGGIGEAPQWLLNIVAVARVGGHERLAVHPPPKRMLWFATDRNFNLLTFVETT